MGWVQQHVAIACGKCMWPAIAFAYKVMLTNIPVLLGSIMVILWTCLTEMTIRQAAFGVAATF